MLVILSESRACIRVLLVFPPKRYWNAVTPLQGAAGGLCRRNWFQAIAHGSGKEIFLMAPFRECTKEMVIKKGLEAGVDYKYTWSCYIGEKEPCGQCGTCIDRQNAFRANSAEDPLLARE